MTVKIKTGKDSKFYMTVYATNGNELAHTTKGYNTLPEIMGIIETLKNGETFCEIETANVETTGAAVYFTIYNLLGEKIMTSTPYNADKGSNPRNTWDRANNQALKGYHATINPKYLAKIEMS